MRVRKRISNGISVKTLQFAGNTTEFTQIIEAINATIPMRGAWFTQLKRDKDGHLVLMEIAARFGGSSSLFRARGVNFAALTLFDAFDYDVSIYKNEFQVEMDRALDTIYKINIQYNEVFVDYDDCLVMRDGTINHTLMAYLWWCINKDIRLTLLTKHETEIHACLREHRMDTLFDRVIQITKQQHKSDYIDNREAIYIDDSFAERQEIAQNCKIPVFGVDMIKGLIQL